MKKDLEMIFSLIKIVIGIASGVIFFMIAFLLHHAYGDSIKTSLEKPKLVQASPVATFEDWDKVENGIHLQTGLVYADGFDLVRGTCTACHSAKLVTQNRATREGWQQMIRWMQETQGLWELGDNEPKILDYLAAYYAPEAIGRRANLDIAEVEWYILDLDAEQ